MTTRRMPIDLDTVVAVASDEDGAMRDAIVGNFVFYQIGEDDLRVTREALGAYMEHYDIDLAYLPAPIEARKVIRSLLMVLPRGKERRKRIRPGGQGAEHSYEYRFTIEDKEGGAIEGVLKRERRRTKAERDKGLDEWDATTVLTVVWTPEDPEAIGAEIEKRWIEEYPYEEIIGEIEEEFETLRTHYTGDAIRKLVTTMLNDSMGVPARPKGGVWVIPRDAIERIKRLRDMVHVIAAQREFEPRAAEGEDEIELELGDGVEFQMVNIVDGEDERLFIRGKVESKVVSEMTGALNALQALINAGEAPAPKDLAAATRIRREALALRDHYRDVIGVQLERVNDTLEMFERLYERAISVDEPAAAEESPSSGPAL